MSTLSPSRLETRLQAEVDAIVAKNRDVFSALVGVSTRDGSFSWSGAAGEADAAGTPMTSDCPFFIASATKIYTAVVAFQLQERGRLSLQDPISRHLPGSLVDGLHRHRGTDYSDRITIYHLLSHTSGLADYFLDRPKRGRSIYDRVIEGADLSWDVEQAVEIAREVGAKFPPDANTGKAHYSDTNYQLLGAILEAVEEKPLEEIYRCFVLEPLGLSSTRLHGSAPAAEARPATVYFKRSPLVLDRAMASFGPDGGLVSTVPEVLRFLRAFFEGELLSEASLAEATRVWRRIFFPLQYGVGLMRFQLPWIFSPFWNRPELIGHSGASSSFAFYSDLGDCYLAGTLNQVASPSRPFRLLLKVADLVGKAPRLQD